MALAIRKEEEGRLQTTIITFNTTSTVLLDQTFREPITVRHIHIEGMLYLNDQITIELREWSRTVYGSPIDLYPDKQTKSIKITPTFGGSRQGFIAIVYEGAYLIASATVGTNAPLFGTSQAMPNIFKTATVSATTDTAIWTPTTGKKFRLLGGVITVPLTCILATAGVDSIILDDGATGMGLQFDVSLATAIASGCIVISFDIKPNGYLSSTANNILNAKLSTALSGGAIRISVWGVEE